MRSVFLIIITSFFSISAISQTNVEIGSIRNLVFPTIIPGISSTVSTTSSNAGKIDVTITKNWTTVSVTFALPTYLSSGNNNIPITFTATKSLNNNDGTLGTSFDPYSGTTIQRTVGNTKNWYIRLGGVINTPTTQTGGIYIGSIIMTISNLGN